MSGVIISPSILSADFANLEFEIKRLKQNGADWIHLDVMDGHFVPNLTIGAPVVKALNRVDDIPLDVHLMISEPEKYIDDFAKAGSDIITFHYEAAQDKIDDILQKIKSYGLKAGLSIKPATPVESIKEYINKFDLILVMTVEPGFGGQKFMEACADKIKEIRAAAQKDIIIEADGGINDKSALYCIKKGADALVAGNYIFSSNDMKKAIESLRCL